MVRSKAVAVFIALALPVAIVGCGKATEDYYFTESNMPRFKVIERNVDYSVAVDTQTGVEYLWTKDGNVMALIDYEGKPYLANGWRDYGGE